MRLLNVSRSLTILRSLLPAVAAAGVLCGCGLMAPRHDAGFARLESLGTRDVDHVMSLSIGPRLLHFAARHVDDDPQVRDMLRSLDGVRVRVYEVNGNVQHVAQRLQDMDQHLRKDGWEPVALTREDGEKTRLLVKTRHRMILGLTLLSVDEGEAVVVNVMGDLDPRFFSSTMAALDVKAPPVRLAAAR